MRAVEALNSGDDIPVMRQCVEKRWKASGWRRRWKAEEAVDSTFNADADIGSVLMPWNTLPIQGVDGGPGGWSADSEGERAGEG